MEIVYLYIKKYKNLEDINLNFGSEFNFEFDFKNEILDVKRNENFIDDFYNITDFAKISNLSGIIGKNGTGKSNILDFIKSNFSRGLNLQKECIFITKEKKKYTIYSTFKLKEKIFLTSFFKFEYKKIKAKEGLNGISFGFDFSGFADLDIVYFSNIYDGLKLNDERTGLYNLSINHLLYNDYQKDLSQHLIQKEANVFEIHETNEVFREYGFLSSEYLKNRIDFDIPDYLTVVVNSNYVLSDESEEMGEFERFKKYFDEIIEFDFSYGVDFKFFISYVILHCAKEIRYQLNSINEVNPDFYKENLKIDELWHIYRNQDTIGTMDYKKVCLRIMELIIDQTKKIVNKEIFKNDSIIKYIENTNSFVSFLFDNYSELKIDYNINRPRIIIRKNNDILFKNFLKQYKLTISVNPYLNFYWGFFDGGTMSSGQKSKLKFYSRFYDLANNKTEKLKNNLIILLDEPDSNLHPEWQKEMIHDFVIFFSEIFDETSTGQNRNIQIVLTSNSPIPISDILSYNTILLDIESNHKVVSKSHLNDLKLTFSQNIYTLFSDSFFMKNGLMGSFAKEKLKDLLEFLESESKEDESWNNNKALKVINMIGEPLIRNSFRELYFEKNNDAIDKEIERLQSLKSKKK